jgi:hypothetical protein
MQSQAPIEALNGSRHSKRSSNRLLAYTAAMKRLFLFALILLSTSTVALAQVVITVPSKSFGVEDQIRAKITNEGTRAIRICVEFGQTSPKNGGSESTPSPFVVQRYSGGRWSTLLIGPDVGSVRRSLEIDAGKSQEFVFRLNDVGKIRLLLYYWRDSRQGSSCTAVEKGAKAVHSEDFVVQ